MISQEFNVPAGTVLAAGAQLPIAIGSVRSIHLLSFSRHSRPYTRMFVALCCACHQSVVNGQLTWKIGSEESVADVITCKDSEGNVVAKCV